MSKRTLELALATPGVDAEGRATRVPLTRRVFGESDFRLMNFLNDNSAGLIRVDVQCVSRQACGHCRD